jgi:hypothetical protein
MLCPKKRSKGQIQPLILCSVKTIVAVFVFWLNFCVFNRDRALPSADGEKIRNWEQQISQVKQTFEKQLWSERTLKTQVRSAVYGRTRLMHGWCLASQMGVDL